MDLKERGCLALRDNALLRVYSDDVLANFCGGVICEHTMERVSPDFDRLALRLFCTNIPFAFDPAQRHAIYFVIVRKQFDPEPNALGLAGYLDCVTLTLPSDAAGGRVDVAITGSLIACWEVRKSWFSACGKERLKTAPSSNICWRICNSVESISRRRGCMCSTAAKHCRRPFATWPANAP